MEDHTLIPLDEVELAYLHPEFTLSQISRLTNLTEEEIRESLKYTFIQRNPQPLMEQACRLLAEVLKTPSTKDMFCAVCNPDFDREQDLCFYHKVEHFLRSVKEGEKYGY